MLINFKQIMRKKLFLAIAMIAYAANGFASNEVTNTLEESDINLPSSTISLQEGVETPNFSRLCSTTTYGYYTTVTLHEGTDMAGQHYSYAIVSYVETGRCTTCISMGHSGTATTKTCTGYGY